MWPICSLWRQRVMCNCSVAVRHHRYVFKRQSKRSTQVLHAYLAVYLGIGLLTARTVTFLQINSAPLKRLTPLSLWLWSDAWARCDEDLHIFFPGSWAEWFRICQWCEHSKVLMLDNFLTYIRQSPSAELVVIRPEITKFEVILSRCQDHGAINFD